jgi:hypothetical protein
MTPRKWSDRISRSDIILLLGVLLVSLIVLSLNQKLSPPSWKAFVEATVIALTVAILTALFTNRLLFEEVLVRVTEANRSSIAVLRLGLSDATIEWGQVDFRTLIRDSRVQVAIIVMSGATWMNQHRDALQQYLDRTNGTLDFLLIDPDCAAAALLQDKFTAGGDTHTAFPDRVRQTIDNIRTFRVPSEGNRTHASAPRIRVRLHQWPFVYSAYRFDDTIILVPYKQAPGRTNEIPAFRLDRQDNRSLFDVFAEDINTCLEDERSRIVHEA